MRVMSVRLRSRRIVGMLAVHANVELRRSNARALHLLGRDRHAIEREPCHGLSNRVERDADVDQRADGHVPADA